jgi:hypothetical protein
MGKNGDGQPTDTILTLEEALMRFKRERSDAGAQSLGEGVSDSNVQEVHSSGTVEHETERKVAKATSYLDPAEHSASVSDQRDEANAEMSASDEIVAVIDGIPRTLAELERIAAAEEAYHEDFPETPMQSAEVDDDDAEPAEMDDLAFMANRHSMIRDYAFTAMGTALMVLVAVLVMHVPIVTDHPSLMAQSIATPALKASPSINTSDLINDAISTLVIVPDAEAQQASASPAPVKSEYLEERIRDTLKGRAFPDIGVSVSTKGDAYLAGEVYSLDEARKISHIVHSVNGVNRVHFLHPDVHPAGGPAFFGVATVSAPSVWGAKVKSVTIGSPADKAGIKPGDVISEFAGNTVPDARYLDLLVAHYSPGQRVQFRVWRDGKPEYLVARLGEVTTVASR